MSVQNKLNLARKLTGVLKKWPDDSHKVYTSFRDAQIKLYDTASPSELPNEETLQLRIQAATTILNNTNMHQFAPRVRLYRPDGNATYYDMIRREANKVQKKTSLIETLKNTAFGWWRK